MHCPFCRHVDSRVVDSRSTDDGASIRRRRQCPMCDRRFTTVEQLTLAVVKRSGVTEPFSRDKVVSGVREACKGRPVAEDALARLAQQVEDGFRWSGIAEVASEEVGLAILPPLRELDEVAYLRFASVYRHFNGLDDFETEIAMLRAENAETVPEPDPTAPVPTTTPDPGEVDPTGPSPTSQNVTDLESTDLEPTGLEPTET